ncbi:MAG: hypothetical protein ACSHXH_15215 [Marivita sp.]|uniref:hypothetical protein n=1 Tax=Marivita sp. TaxID=2003365 RepID=UPI003EF4C395
MTDKDTDKEALDPVENPEKKTTPAKTTDGKTSHEPAASTDERQPRKPSDDDDPFDNLPV